MSNLTELFTSVADAIREKKGTTDKIVASKFPSEIATIETGSQINGTEDVTVKAYGNVIKNNICSLSPARGGLETVKTSLLPTSFLFGNSSTALTVNGTKRIISLDNGNLILMPYGSSLVPFYLVNGVYTQMKTNGTYATLRGYGSSGHDTESSGYPYAYDADTNTLFLSYFYVSKNYYTYRLFSTVDTENLNISATTYLSTSGRYGQPIYAKNSHVILHSGSSSELATSTYISKLNKTSNTYTDTKITKYSGGTFDHVCDLNGDLGNGQIICVCQTNANGSTELYLANLVYNGSTYSVVGYSSLTPNAKTSSNNYLTGFGGDTYAQINASGDRLYYLDTSNTLHQVNVNTSTMELEEVALSFDDGLDITTIEAFTLVKGDNLIYVKSTDGIVRLYKHDNGSNTLTFVGRPDEIFNTPTASGELPVQPHFISGKNTIIKAVTNLMSLYNVGFAKLDYDYTCSECNNKLSNDTNVTAYGLATEDISDGEIGEAKLILK